MAPSYSDDVSLTMLSGIVDEERQRATRAAQLAAKYEEPPPAASLQPLYDRMAVLNRRLAARHAGAAELHERHIARIEQHSGDDETNRPTLLSTVAATLSTPTTAVTLRGLRRALVVVATSDVIAQAAQDLEQVMNEGPATTVMMDGATVGAGATAMLDRWPRYGPAAAELGVRSVIAAPLRLSTACLGTICAYDSAPVVRPDMASATEAVADALAQSVLDGVRSGAALGLFDDADFQPLVHQAAGMIAVYHDCGVDDAEELLRAHAFAENRPVADIAADVVHRRARLD
jgi:hypothetical protein